MFVPPYPGWFPYCLMCKTILRMEATPYGYQCRCCKNKIKHDCTHYDGGSAWDTASHKAACCQCGEQIEVGDTIYINDHEVSCDGCGDPMDPGTVPEVRA